MKNIEHLFAGLPKTAGGITAKIEVADKVIGQTVEQLIAAGTPPAQVAIVLGCQLKAIADKEGWTDEMKAEFLGSRLLACRMNDMTTMPDLDIVLCPGCAASLPVGNSGCPDCGYENNEDGRLLTLAEILQRPSYPAPGAMRLNDVSPAFLQAVTTLARGAALQEAIDALPAGSIHAANVIRSLNTKEPG